MSSQSRTVKSIQTKSFGISVMERENGAYYVEYQKSQNKSLEETKDVRDLNMAFSVFETIYRELVGQ